MERTCKNCLNEEFCSTGEGGCIDLHGWEEIPQEKIDKKEPNLEGESARDELISDIFSSRIRAIIEKETLEKVKVRLQNVKTMAYYTACEIVGLYFREIQKMIYEIEENGGLK